MLFISVLKYELCCFHLKSNDKIKTEKKKKKKKKQETVSDTCENSMYKSVLGRHSSDNQFG